MSQLSLFYFPSASNFNRAALDRAASPANASPRLTLLDQAEEPVDCEAATSSDGFLESGVTLFAVVAMPRLDRLCKTEDGEVRSLGCCCDDGGCCCCGCDGGVADSERLHWLVRDRSTASSVPRRFFQTWARPGDTSVVCLEPFVLRSGVDDASAATT